LARVRGTAVGRERSTDDHGIVVEREVAADAATVFALPADPRRHPESRRPRPGLLPV